MKYVRSSVEVEQILGKLADTIPNSSSASSLSNGKNERRGVQ